MCEIIGDILIRGPISDCFTLDLQLGVYTVLFCDGFVELPSITKRKTFSSSDMGPISSSRCFATSSDRQRVESSIDLEALANWKTRPSVRQMLFVTLVAWASEPQVVSARRTRRPSVGIGHVGLENGNAKQGRWVNDRSCLGPGWNYSCCKPSMKRMIQMDANLVGGKTCLRQR